MGVLITLSGVRLFLLLSLPYFLLIYLLGFRRKASKYTTRKVRFIWLVLLFINLGLAYYVSNLLSDTAIFYFPRPYKEEGRWLLNLSSYFPVGLLLLFIPVTVFAALYYRKSRDNYQRSMLLLNMLSYGILLALFAYWGLYALS